MFHANLTNVIDDYVKIIGNAMNAIVLQHVAPVIQGIVVSTGNASSTPLLVLVSPMLKPTLNDRRRDLSVGHGALQRDRNYPVKYNSFVLADGTNLNPPRGPSFQAWHNTETTRLTPRSVMSTQREKKKKTTGPSKGRTRSSGYH